MSDPTDREILEDRFQVLLIEATTLRTMASRLSLELQALADQIQTTALEGMAAANVPVSEGVREEWATEERENLERARETIREAT